MFMKLGGGLAWTHYILVWIRIPADLTSPTQYLIIGLCMPPLHLGPGSSVPFYLS